MSDERVERMRETGTLMLNKWQLFWHYLISMTLLLPPVMMTVYAFKDGKVIKEPLLWTYLLIIPAVALYYIQKRRLKFKTIPLSVDAKVFVETVRETAEQLEWTVVEQTPTLFVAKSGFSWNSWGELITIIHDKDRILFNSICDPDNMPSIASWGKNRSNRKTFEQYLQMKVTGDRG